MIRRTRALSLLKDKAETEAKSRRQRLSFLTHEVKTPLNGVMGALELLSSKIQDTEQHDLLKTALICSESLMEMVDNYLDFDSSDMGKLELSEQPTRLFDLIDQVMQIVSNKALMKGLSLSTLVNADVPFELSLDPHRYRQILVNLLGNAIKFTDTGEIRVIVSVLSGQLRVSIADTGCGISADKLPFIFEPFVRDRREVIGTGLGLSIAKSLSKLMAGDIRVTSQVGVGSVFTLNVPIKGAQYQTLSTKQVSSPLWLCEQLIAWGISCQTEPDELPSQWPAELRYLPGELWKRLSSGSQEHVSQKRALSYQQRTLHVLVVDDIQTNLTIMQRMLQALGHKVTCCLSGREALELCEEALFDLVLMDIRMPEMDGFETCVRFKADDSAVLDPDCPVIAVTASSHGGLKHRLNEVGMLDFIQKPVSMECLSSVLDKVISYQLERGIELALNSKLDKPLLLDPGLKEELQLQLKELLKQLTHAIELGEVKMAESLTHAMKGAAGQGGEMMLHDKLGGIEIMMRQGKLKFEDELKQIGRLINKILI
ncbi:ATP-binding protein [Dongshaea marina]|uniref:ATP-binding protein n=1 Tax=Dongshaea marina TaxID=2047966 RepID=UPI00131EE6E4|nr:ATP-binding protein [Dongshaea marina]